MGGQPAQHGLWFRRRGAAPHLKQPEVYNKYVVDIEDKDPKSTLNFYRKAMNLRHKLQALRSSSG